MNYIVTTIKFKTSDILYFNVYIIKVIIKSTLMLQNIICGIGKERVEKLNE